MIAKHSTENTDKEEGLEDSLRSWWSKTYNRPLKDPLLQEYTIYELMYEFHDKSERVAASEKVIEEETDKIEGAEQKEVLDWAEEEEKKEKAEAALKADEQWMLDQLKNEFGDDFGEDINTNF